MRPQLPTGTLTKLKQSDRKLTLADNAPESKPARQIDSYPKSIADVLDLFVKQVDGLAETLPLAVRAIRFAQITAQKELHKFIQDECTHDESGKTFIVEAGKGFH